MTAIVKTDTDAKAAPDAKRPSFIHPDHVFRQSDSNFRFRGWQIFLPDGVWIQQLRDWPDIWSKVQAVNDRNRTITRFDTLQLIAFDQTRLTETPCVFADRIIVRIDAEHALKNQVKMPAIMLPKSAEYEAIIAGPVYAIRRIGDGAIVKQDVQTLEALYQEMNAIAPRRVAA